MSKIVIVGAGALGSHAALFLRNEVEDLKVIDFDRVEKKNVLSQFHSKSTVGKNKVQGLAATMNFLFGRKIETVPHKLTNDNASQLLSGADLVLDCVDNLYTRNLLSTWKDDLEYALLHGALAPGGEFGRVIWDKDFQPDHEGEGEQATCEDGEFLPFIALTAAYLAQAAQEFLKNDRKIGYQVHPGGATVI
jgi:molybdopterin/thiamine biosynthesis adenylyltransferase